jgi:hypothetical protein
LISGLIVYPDTQSANDNSTYYLEPKRLGYQKARYGGDTESGQSPVNGISGGYPQTGKETGQITFGKGALQADDSDGSQRRGHNQTDHKAFYKDGHLQFALRHQMIERIVGLLYFKLRQSFHAKLRDDCPIATLE